MTSLKTKQHIFNEIKGHVLEWNCDQDWCNLVVKVGHENTRLVNFVCKAEIFAQITDKIKLEKDLFVLCRFYVSSRKSNDRYYTNATLLSISKAPRSII